MSATCQESQSWMSLQGAEEIAVEDSARHAAHLAICSDCQGRLQGYNAMLLTAQSVLDFEPSERAVEAFAVSATQLSLSPKGHAWRETAADALAFSPSVKGASAFLRAARQQTAHRQISTPMRVGAWPMLAAAAGLLVALTLWGTRDDAPLVVPQNSATTIEIAQHRGSVWINGALITEDVQGPMADATRIVTGEGSSLTLKGDAGDVVTLSSRSEVRVEDWRRRSRQIVLKAGSVHAQVSHRRVDEHFEVLTPNARVIVVGTEFTVTYSAANETVVAGASGIVRVERLDGTPIGFVRAGDVLRVPAKVAEALPSQQAPAVAPREAQVAAPTPAVSEVRLLPSAITPRRHKGPRARPQTQNAPQETGGTVVTTAQASPKPVAAPNQPLEQARAWLAEGKEAEAIALLEATPPRDWRRDALLGDAYQLIGSFERALRAYQDALKRTTQPPVTLVADIASLLARRMNRPTEAAAHWARYLDLYPQGSDAAKALLYLADHARTTGRTDEASELYRSLLERFPHKPQARQAFTRLGSALLEAKRWKKAEILFAPHMMAGTHTNAEVALVGMIRVRMGQGQRDEAVRLISLYQARFPLGNRRAEVQRMDDALGAPKPVGP